jgi:molybdopterin molybdotransferase
MNETPAMLAFEEALALVLASARYLGAETVPLSGASGRVLAADIVADDDQPPFDKSAMDGFACRCIDLPGSLAVTETIAAGAVPRQAVAPGQCARIMTGAPVPPGADCVVKFEDTETPADGTVRCAGVGAGTNIRRQGEDVRRGEVVLTRGMRIAAPHIAVLASVGCSLVPVARRPRVAIIATGDELVAVDALPGPGQIRNSNGPQLAAQAAAAGALPDVRTPVRDEAAALRDAIAAALADGEVVVLSGGVSAGDFDLVPQALRDCGLEIRFDRIAMKPGRPTTFAVKDGAWCFGLPGNPVSTFLQFEVLVRPLLVSLMGGDPAPRTFAAPLAATVSRRGAARQAWLPVRLTAEGEAQPLDYHGSAHIQSLCHADGFIVLPVGTTRLDKGALVHVRPVPAAH